MKLKLNKEFALRHLGVAALMAALGGWFAYDGFVTYPRTPAPELYAKAHGGEQAPSLEQAEKYKTSAIPRQRQFMAICWVFALYLGLNVWRLSRKDFALDGKITEIDDRDWKKKGILRFKVDGKKTVLDAWHHADAKALAEKILANNEICA